MGAVSSRWQHLDLLTAGALTLLTALLVVAFPAWHSPLRTFLGFTVVLLLPGYVFQTLLFPKKGDVDGIERVPLTLGLSIVVLPLLGLLLNYTPWGIRTGPIAVGLALVVVVLALASYARRVTIRVGEPYFLDVRLPDVRQGMLVFGLVVVVVGGVPSLAVALRPAPHDTEFYVLGSDRRPEDYPRTLAPGASFQLTFGVTNRGPGPQDYTIRFPFEQGADRRADHVLVPMLQPGGAWEMPVTLTAPAGHGRTELDFDLYRTGRAEPYRRLHLFVTIAATASSSAGATTGGGPSGTTRLPTAPPAVGPAAGVTAVHAKGFQSYRVQPGDTMYGIAKRFYGDGNAYPRIVAANRDRLKDFRQVPVGLELRIPRP